MTVTVAAWLVWEKISLPSSGFLPRGLSVFQRQRLLGGVVPGSFAEMLEGKLSAKCAVRQKDPAHFLWKTRASYLASFEQNPAGSYAQT